MHWTFASLWVLETLIFLGYLIAYLRRKSPQKAADSWRTALFPFLPALLPFLLILEIPDLLGGWESLIQFQKISHWDYFYPKISLLILGNSITMMSLWTLGSSYSIVSEARECIKTGPYRWITHPMYFGQFLTFLGVTLFRSSAKNWIIYGLFVLLQYRRLKNEEEVLKEAFSDYEEYRRSCWIRF